MTGKYQNFLMNIQAINDPRQLLSDKYEQSHYAFDNFIKVASWRDRSRSKKKLKLLKAIDPVIPQLLDGLLIITIYSVLFLRPNECF